MKAAVLIRYGKAENAFSIREVEKPVCGEDEILIQVAASGLNFADVMARCGLYKEAPALPAILGYDVAGTIVAIGKNVTHLKINDRVTAMTRFGGYAEYAVTKASAAAVIPENMDDATATSLTTQYCTAYYMAAEMVNLNPGDKVLIHSGAGGVGTALIQLAKHKGCEIFSTAGSQEKLNLLNRLGVHHAINYNSSDFETAIKKITGSRGVDVIFDAVGGLSIRKGFRLLGAGGRLLCYGAATMSDKNIFGKIKALLGFGFYHPLMLMSPSKSLIGINMLPIADNKPELLQKCLNNVVRLCNEGVFNPPKATRFSVADIGTAHAFLEKRKSTGKVALTW